MQYAPHSAEESHETDLTGSEARLMVGAFVSSYPRRLQLVRIFWEGRALNPGLFHYSVRHKV